jgi:Fe2+ or Zn2+ uptake regulation protein
VLEDWVSEISSLKIRLGPVSPSTNLRDISELLGKHSKVHNKDSQQGVAASSEASEAQSTKSMGGTSEEKRIKKVRKYSQRLITALKRNLKEFPYGLRFVCRQIRRSMISRMLTDQSINRTLAMLIFDGFISPYLCQYDEKQIMDGMRIGRNFPVLHNVLGKVFSFTRFSKDSKFAPLNDWLIKMQLELEDWLQDVTEVQDPEIVLGFDETDEQLAMEKPFLFIDSQDMAFWARFFLEHGSEIIEEEDIGAGRSDVLSRLSNRIPDPHRVLKREIHLDLISDMIKDAEIIAAQDTESLLYEETRVLTATVFRDVALQVGRTYTLHQILETAEGQKDYLEKQVRKIRKNLKELEASGRVTSAKNYAAFVRDVAAEITHHPFLLQDRENRVSRLQNSLKKLARYRVKLEKRRDEYTKYHGICRDNAARKKAKAAGKKKSYNLKAWTKAGILLPETPGFPFSKDTKFKVRMPEVGIFELEVKFGGQAQGNGRVKLEDLLELRKEGGTAACSIYEFYPDKLLQLLNEDFLM